MEKISIIVPIYNVEKYLKKCIDSIISQSYTNLEIILVDDESPDSCPTICEEYKKKDKRIKVIHQKNMGLSGARNTGIKAATGKYIMFQDSDDTIDYKCVEILYKLIKEYKTKISICGRLYEFENGDKKCKYSDNFIKKYDLESAIEEMNSFYYFDMSACGKMFYKQLFEDIEFPVGKLSEDYYVMYKLFLKSGNVVYTTEPMYNYLQRQNSISKNKKVNTQFIDAAYAQMVDLEKYNEKMKIIVHTAYASAYLTVIDTFINQKMKCPKKILKDAKITIKNNKSLIKNNKNLNKTKKIQFYLFSINYYLYRIIFKIYRIFVKI